MDRNRQYWLKEQCDKNHVKGDEGCSTVRFRAGYGGSGRRRSQVHDFYDEDNSVPHIQQTFSSQGKVDNGSAKLQIVK